MKNFLPFSKKITILLISFLSVILNDSFLLADTGYPVVVPNSQVDEPFCYMQTSDGRRINLEALCGQNQRQNLRNTQSCNSRISAADVSITNVNYNGEFLSGGVRNQTCKTLKSVRVNYEVQDESGNPIDNGFIAAQPSTIPPGGSASFRGMVMRGSEVQATHVDWSE